MRQLAAKCHLADSRLADSRVGDLLTLLVGFKLLYREFASLPLAANGLKHTTVGSAADEADNPVLVRNPDLTLVADIANAPVGRVLKSRS